MRISNYEFQIASTEAVNHDANLKSQSRSEIAPVMVMVSPATFDISGSHSTNERSGENFSLVNDFHL
jgi:hypothetical protein